MVGTRTDRLCVQLGSRQFCRGEIVEVGRCTVDVELCLLGGLRADDDQARPVGRR